MSRTAPKTVRILLIDDHALFRESVARLLDAEPGFEVVGDCSSSAEALRILKSREVDMILLDLDLGTERGSDLLEKLQGRIVHRKNSTGDCGRQSKRSPEPDSERHLGHIHEAWFAGIVSSRNPGSNGRQSHF